MNATRDGETDRDRGPRDQPVILSVQSTAEDGFDLIDLWQELVAGRWILLICVAVMLAVAVGYLFLAQPVYRAEALLAPVEKDETSSALAGLGGLAAIAGVKVGGESDAAEAIAMLTAKKFLADFINDLKLMPVLYVDRWDSAAKRWRSSDPAEIPDVRDGVAYLIDDVVTVAKDTDTGFVTLTVEWRDPAVAAKWAQTLVVRANEAKRNQDIKESERKLAYLDGQLAKANLVELRQAIARVIEDQIGKMTVAQAQHEYAFKIIDPAIAPKEPIWPQPVLLAIAAISLGVLFGLVIIVLRLLRRSLSASRD